MGVHMNSNEHEENSCDILQVEGINSKGFGIVPKLLMQDERLSIYSKAIYCYFCSYAGSAKKMSAGQLTAESQIRNHQQISTS